MVKYKLSEDAEEDLVRIYSYGFHNFGSLQAEKYYDSFFEQFDKIAERPFSFESVSYLKGDYRRSVCGSDTIYFRIEGEVVQIMAIIGRQDLNSLI